MSARAPSQGAGTLVSFHHRAVAGATGEGTMDAWIMGMTLSGRADMRVAREPMPSTPGTLVVLRPRTFNSWMVPDALPGRGIAHWECVYCSFVPRPHWIPWLRFPEVLPGYSLMRFPSRSLTGAIRSELLRVHALATGGARDGQELALNALEKALLLARSGVDGGTAEDAAMDPRIRRALDHLHAHLGKPIRLASLASLSDMSRSHLAALFKAQVGASPLAYHERLRIEDAARRLRMSYESVDGIASSLGFCDAKYFAKRFQRLMGETPRRFRC